MLVLCLMLSACGGVAWNTTVADHAQVRHAMLGSVVPGQTTEKRFVLQWGQPTQKMREGAQVAYIYRNMSNPAGYYVPQYGVSQAYVIVLFQYGLAVGAYSSDTEGCRATFAPRPPGQGMDNPSTVHTVNCGVAYDGSSEYRPIAEGIDWLARQTRDGGRRVADRLGGPLEGALPMPQSPPMAAPVPLVPDDSYGGGTLK